MWATEPHSVSRPVNEESPIGKEELVSHLTFHFAHSAGRIELEQTVFRASSDMEFVAVRGKTSGAYGCTGSFQWTPGVKAVCVFFLQALGRSRAGCNNSAPIISGGRGSLASSFDYAINKEPQWLCDMFGLDAAGKTNLRRLIFRSNTNIKRPGPVSLSLNHSALAPEDITVLLDSTPVDCVESLDEIISSLLGESRGPMKLLQSVHRGKYIEALDDATIDVQVSA